MSDHYGYHFVTLTLQVQAAGKEEALEFGMNMTQHLHETFNDDASIAATSWVQIGLPPSQQATVLYNGV